jgi:acyl carrier protein
MEYSSEPFLEIFKIELNDDSLTMVSEFKKHEGWSSLLSLLLITELDAKFGYLATVEDLRSAETIQDLYNRYMKNV